MSGQTDTIFSEAALWRTMSSDTLKRMWNIRLIRIRELESMLECIQNEIETIDEILDEKRTDAANV